jgi:TATA-binding protein-associated factor
MCSFFNSNLYPIGKTLQALSAVALTHEEAARADASSKPVSLVVCPSTLVGHWLAEIRKFFPRQSVLRGSSNICKRNKGAVVDVDCNIVVISYSILRREAAALSNIKWHYCILDEGHLLKNPKTGPY